MNKKAPEQQSSELPVEHPVTASPWIPDLVLAIDGSHIPQPVVNGYPGASIEYLTVAAVLLDLKKLRALDAHRPVDPRQFRDTETTASIDEALPGANVVIDAELSAPSSLRKTLFELLVNTRMAPDAESLLETYQAILPHKPSTHHQECPYDSIDDCPAPDRGYLPAPERYTCTCHLKRALYSTDALRIHEGMEPAGANGAMFAEIMQVLERLWMIHVLRWLESRTFLTTLRRLAIVLDGPLAVFGHPAWLSHAISKELRRLNDEARRVNNGQDILLVGIEKTGLFVDHFLNLDQGPRGQQGKLKPRSILLLDDPYIKRNIIYSQSTKPYGLDTYFGRKFFYKTASGALVVATLPFLRDGDNDTSRAQPTQFPRLADALSLLDQMVSSRFPNSLVPLVSAHAEAAIPLRLGTRVLEELAKKLMPEASAVS